MCLFSEGNVTSRSPREPARGGQRAKQTWDMLQVVDTSVQGNTIDLESTDAMTSFLSNFRYAESFQSLPSRVFSIIVMSALSGEFEQ